MKPTITPCPAPSDSYRKAGDRNREHLYLVKAAASSRTHRARSMRR
jgi:hypothetical protein